MASASKASALTVVGLAVMVIGLVTRDRMGAGAFGLSGDYLTGALMGVAIGLLVLAVALAARRRGA